MLRSILLFIILSLITPAVLAIYSPSNDTQPLNIRSQATAIYHRSDEYITQKVKAKLLADKDTKDLKITITTQDSKVELTGTVETTALRDKVVSLTQHVKGVRLVIDDLTVGPPEKPQAKQPDSKH